jgi:predicted Zn finger-like uncharacterized protein
MDGTTLCPHCNTRFKIAESQLALRKGMVRCGQCLQPFDARPSYIATHESAQFTEQSSLTSVDFPIEPLVQQSNTELSPPPKEKQVKKRVINLLAGIFSLFLLVALVSQATYFFRIDLAARYPNLQPTLLAYCHLISCEVPLPQQAELMSIEASDLEAIPEQADQIILNASLRNRSNYPQAFPFLELTLNDTQDKPLARRIFQPIDYLPRTENERIGLTGNHEITIKLHLNISDLKATGYRLVLFYPKNTL